MGIVIGIVIGIVLGTVPLTHFRASGKNCSQAAFSLRDWNPTAKAVAEKYARKQKRKRI